MGYDPNKTQLEKKIKETAGLFAKPKLHYPLNDKVIQRCKDEMDVNSHKGNSWETCEGDFMVLKLTEEFAEAINAMKDDPSMAQKELADLINVAAMLFHRF